ncbi:MAG: hypothetical protein LYZ69_06535 [Nitrososphaerales archaeon]|nr:hypothetical protein [Nitrososphaerales archaeon]
MHVTWFRVKRSAGVGEYRLADVFRGLEASVALQKVFGSKEEMSKILRHLKLRVEATDSGLWLDRDTGTICVGHKHLSSAKSDFIYLDIIHVLVHVRQFLEGRELYDQAFEYVERPTELEAYRNTVAEARRVGMKEDEILKYLRMDAADDSELGKLMEKIGVKARR